MRPPNEELERLITRCLDDEATLAERARLESWVRREPEAAALWEEYAYLDREVGLALREALGRPETSGLRCGPWARLASWAGFAAAAAVVLAVWLHPGRPGPGPRVAGPAQAASWFAPPQVEGDVVEATAPDYIRPRFRIRDTDRDWIVVPGRRAGEYLLIEVDRVHTLAVPLQGDF